MGEFSDAELLALYRKEESRNYAFNLLVRQYQRRLYAFIRRMVTDHDEAQDVLQNTFIKAWKGLDRFREESQLYSWLYRIAHNECLSHLRRQRRHLFVSDAKAIERLTTTLDSSEHFSGDAIQRRLQAAVLRLPDKQRAVFIMKYFEGLKYEEMSTATGTSVGALKSSYHIAVKKIEQWLVMDQTKDAPQASKSPTSDDKTR
ncbi:MAG: sigma-70 family RNA polymerase sigma factor [Flavobacteriales bacterium]|nr:sigma-70 family RNA polymerase sigma factor [Flavobacteriales bacterium]